VYRSDRVSHGGGVAIYVNKKLKAKIICQHTINSAIEYIFLEIQNPISDILRESHLTSNMESLGLKPVNLSFPIHFSRTRNTLLDLFFVSDVNKICLYDQLIVPSFSRHDLIYLTYNFDLNYTDHIISYRDFKNINYILLNEVFDQCVWNNIYSLPTVDRQLYFLKLNISHLYDNFVPVKSKRIRPSEKPWSSNNIKLAIIKRNEEPEVEKIQNTATPQHVCISGENGYQTNRLCKIKLF